jgi:hypothetical protein
VDGERKFGGFVIYGSTVHEVLWWKIEITWSSRTQQVRIIGVSEALCGNVPYVDRDSERCNTRVLMSNALCSTSFLPLRGPCPKLT